MKLTPNVTDITEIAKAAEAGGADAISLINTLTGMKIDINRKTFALANKTGGVSGPIVHPIAVRMVYQAAQAVKIPIIGMGGIASAEDAIEIDPCRCKCRVCGNSELLSIRHITEGCGRRHPSSTWRRMASSTVADMVGIVK